MRNWDNEKMRKLVNEKKKIMRNKIMWTWKYAKMSKWENSKVKNEKMRKYAMRTGEKN